MNARLLNKQSEVNAEFQYGRPDRSCPFNLYQSSEVLTSRQEACRLNSSASCRCKHLRKVKNRFVLHSISRARHPSISDVTCEKGEGGRFSVYNFVYSQFISFSRRKCVHIALERVLCRCLSILEATGDLALIDSASPPPPPPPPPPLCGVIKTRSHMRITLELFSLTAYKEERDRVLSSFQLQISISSILGAFSSF